MMHCFCGLVGSYCWSSALPEDVDNLSVKHGDAAAKGREAADKGAVWGSSEEQVTGKTMLCLILSRVNEAVGNEMISCLAM